MRGTTRFASLVLAMVAFSPAVAKMYWKSAVVDTTTIQRADLDGGNVEAILSCSVACGFGPLAIDPIGGKIYFNVVGGPQEIARANLDGSDQETVLPSPGIGSLAVDPVAAKMYWADDQGPGDRIRRAGLDGSGAETLLEGLLSVRGLSVDPAGKIYWTEESPARLRRADLDGSDAEDLVTGAGTFSDTTLDLRGGVVYWLAGNQIRRADLDGSNAGTLPVALSGPSAIAFEPSNGMLYLTVVPAPFSGSIVRVDPAGNTAVEVLSGLGAASEIAVDAGGGGAVPATSDAIAAGAALLLLAASSLLVARRL